jgi:hypothetical protein
MKAVRGDRGPDPDIADDEERILVPVRLLDQLARNGGYQEAPKKESLKSTIITCTISLAVVLGGAAVGLISRVSSLEATVIEKAKATDAWQLSADKRLDRLEARP